MSNKLILDSGSDDDDAETFGGAGGQKEFKINQSYAESYNRFREKEVYQRLKDKYGEAAASKSLDQANLDDDDSSSESSEDEDAEALTEEVEKDFFKTLAMLKTKDPRIYDNATTFFSENKKESKDLNSKAKSSKPMTIGDLQRKVILENEGQYEEMPDKELLEKANRDSKTYVQEMEELKGAFKDDNDDEDDEDEDLFKPKQKTEAEKAKEESDYRQWLAGQKGAAAGDQQVEKELGGLRSYWNRKDLSKDEKFLRDYILNKKYLGDDHDDYDEEENGEGEEEQATANGDLDEDEADVRNQEEFEVKYNFRFEEPDAEFIKRYPRTMSMAKDEALLRKKDTSRKRKREELKAKKEEEKAKQREELKQLKALKRKEIIGKIRKLEKVTGTEMAFKEDDLDADFDPEEYDKRMAEVFENYDVTGTENADDVKPEFSDLSDVEDDFETENWDEWGGDEDDDDDDGDDVTATSKGNDDVTGNDDDDAGEGTSKATRKELEKEMLAQNNSGKPRKKSKFEEALSKSKPVFDPNDKTFQEYLDEYYGLDYEDTIGDLKCRFKYRQVEASGFGLSTEEILSAPDRELNAWCSLKKTCQFRPADEERQEFQEFERKGKNIKLKQKILPSLFKEDAEEDLEAERVSKAKKSRKRKRKNKQEDDNEANENLGENSGENLGENLGELGEKSEKQTPSEDTANKEPSAKKRKRKNKNKGGAGGSNDQGGPVDNAAAAAGNGVEKSKDNKKNHNKNNKKNFHNKSKKPDEIQMSDDRLKAYGLVPNQYKRKVKKAKYINKS